MSTIFSVLQMVWHFFTEVQCPFLGISFANLFIGIFAVNFSIRLLKPLLGIGSSVVRSADRGVAGLRRASSRRRFENKE